MAEGYLLRDTWRHRTLPKRGAGPGPFAGRAGLRTTGVRLLGRQGVVKDNYETLVQTQQEGYPSPGVPTEVLMCHSDKQTRPYLSNHRQYLCNLVFTESTKNIFHTVRYLKLSTDKRNNISEQRQARENQH